MVYNGLDGFIQLCFRAVVCLHMVAFLKSNNEVISILIGIFSIVVSLWGMYFGRKAYHVAKEIFEKGLRIDQQKVLQQISLEFVTGFFMPLSKFKTAPKSILGNLCDKQSVLYVRGLIKDNRLSVQFPYFDVHKGEVWDSLTICNNMEQSEAFNTIMDFVEKARNFDRVITDLSDRLNDYLNPSGKEDIQRRAGSTLRDFFDTCPSVNQDMFNKGLEMIGDLSQYENRLPEELRIPEMKKELFRDECICGSVGQRNIAGGKQFLYLCRSSVPCGLYPYFYRKTRSSG